MFIQVILNLFILATPSYSTVPVNALDLECEPSGISDGGYSVIAKLKEDGSLRASADTVSGWGSSQNLYKGPLKLTRAVSNGQCSIKLVDSEDSPQIVVALHLNAGDILERVKNKDLGFIKDGKIINFDNKLECHVSPKLEAILKNICQ